MAGNAGSGPKPAKLKMSDMVRIVGGVTRGTRQPVREVKVDTDGNLTMTMVVRDDEGPIGPPTQSEIEAERSAWDQAVAEDRPAEMLDTEPGLGNK